MSTRWEHTCDNPGQRNRPVLQRADLVGKCFEPFTMGEAKTRLSFRYSGRYLEVGR